MSVTTVLVPVQESEAEELLEGHAPPELYSRADRLRRQIGRVDAIREELHELLVPRWIRERPKPRRPVPKLLSPFFAKPEPPKIPTGYDPYIHLFGRSFPITGATSKDVVEHLTKLLALDDAAFEIQLTQELRALDLTASERYAQSPRVATPADLRPQIERLLNTASSHTDLRAAYTAIVTLSAWSWPVWRLDGELLPDLARTVGITVVPSRPAALFEELKERDPTVEEKLQSFPTRLPDFASAGTYWSALEVKSVAGSLRLHRSMLAKNAVENADDELTTLRNLRLLEEAVLFCEAESLGLAEAAGIEWHDRPKQHGT